MDQSVPKRRHITFRRRGITQKKTYKVGIYLLAYEDGTDSVPKRRHITFRRRGITQKKTYKVGIYILAYEDGTDRVFRNVGI
jgi:hypothetical protein